MNRVVRRMSRTLDRKPRIQGKIAKLSPAQQLQLRAWMHAGITYKEIALRARERFGVSISNGSLCEYYSKHRRKMLLDTASASEATPEGPLHATLILHIQIRPELLPVSAS
jgi:hypothetical protein